MNHELICSWLGLPPDDWPPDHYRLLGLNPGESDVALIEQRVHQRLDAVRRYQMMHGEEATEAMNRLAQAFVCLTEPATKIAYDVSLLGETPAVPPPLPPAPPPQLLAPTPPPLPLLPAPPPLPPAIPVLEPVERLDPLEWLAKPGIGPTGEPLPSSAVVVEPPPAVETPPPPLPSPPPPPVLIDPVVEAAQSAPQVKRGLATKRALYHRVARTRRLLRLWRRAGKQFSDPSRTLNRPAVNELYKVVKELDEEVAGFPLLGEAGQPGYLIVALRQLDRTQLLGLAFSQRQSLERDWKAGLKFLEAHRDYLRSELRAYRRRSRTERLVRAVRAYFNEDPLAAVVLLLGLVALAVAIYQTAW